MTLSMRLTAAMVGLVVLTLAAVALLTPAAFAPSSLIAAAVAIACAAAMALLLARALASARRSEDAAHAMASPRRRPDEIEVARQSARERLYAAAVEYSNAIVTETLDGVITAWNPAAERMFGYPAREAIGKNVEVSVPRNRRAELRNILAKLARGESINHFETARITRDGRRIDVSLSVSPVKSATGEIIGGAKIARDISERRKAQVDLVREIEERRQIFETSLDLILVTDRKGVFLNVSPSAKDTLGYAPDEMIGRNAIDFIHPGDLHNTRNEMRLARSGAPCATSNAATCTGTAMSSS